MQLIAGGGIAATGGIRPAVADGADKDDVGLLAAVLFDLFPFDDLEPAVYAGAAQSILSRNDPRLGEGLPLLREMAAGRPWIDLEERERVRILSSLQEHRFFGFLRAAAIERLFRDEALWSLIGYGGSAIEHGGYVHRGFDDIGWLPAQEGLQ